MLLGKRARPPMRRTTSLSEITFDLNKSSDGDAMQCNLPQNMGTNLSQQRPMVAVAGVGAQQRHLTGNGGSNVNGLDRYWLLSAGSPGNHRRNSADSLETAHFLRACSLCNCRLVPGRDIYMYMGDSAFCSLECRQQQMNQDDRKYKCSLGSKKRLPVPTAASPGSTTAETVAAL